MSDVARTACPAYTTFCPGSRRCRTSLGRDRCIRRHLPPEQRVSWRGRGVSTETIVTVDNTVLNSGELKTIFHEKAHVAA